MRDYLGALLGAVDAVNQALGRVRREVPRVVWRRVLLGVERGQHPSPERLGELVRRYGVPEFALSYVAGRVSGEIRPRGRPARDPAGFVGELTGVPDKHWEALHRLYRRHDRYASFQTAKEPRESNRPALAYVASRGVWKVRGPRERAVEETARRENVAPSTLMGWERDAIRRVEDLQGGPSWSQKSQGAKNSD